MEFVEPIRDRKKLAQIKNQLRGERRYRDLLLFVVGINTALRVSDLLKLQISDFVDTDGNIRSTSGSGRRNATNAMKSPSTKASVTP